MIPTLGRIVIATIEDSQLRIIQRPAIIVRVWGETADSAVNAHVFCDSNGGPDNDGLPPTVWKTSLAHDETGQGINTWRWPDRK